MRPKRGRNQWKPHNKGYKQYVKKPEYRHCDQLSEKDVYITEYLSSLDGFSGVIKARYSDFQLNEINLEGQIAKLTNTDIPKDFSLKMRQYNYNEVIESPNKDIPQETWELIKKIVDDSNGQSVILHADNIDKDSRKELHNCMKSHFGNKVIASTIQIEGRRAIKFEKYRKEIYDARSQWPVDKGEYVHFIVYKEKMDTLETVLKMSSAIGMSASSFHHAGTKDKRSITSQWFCVRKIDPWKLIVKTKQLPNIKIGNITFKDIPIRLGDLKGNKFRIALRNVSASDEVINGAMNHLKEHNFINYYGLQRFGNDKEVPTHEVGISLLLGKWKEATELILKPKSSDDPNSPQGDVVEAKKIYAATGDAAKAYAALQRNRTKSLEGKLLEGLKNSSENDYVNALEKIPRTMRLLYLHAFQSLIWNEMVSKRLQLFGTRPVVGDLVLINGNTCSEGDVEIDEPEAKSSKDGNEITREIRCKAQVQPLGEGDLDRYTIYDIVLPLPGYDVIYPEHMKNHYQESLEEHGLTLEMTKQKVRTYSLSGNYRRIFGRIEDLSWKIVRYNNPTDNLILSDLQEMRGETQVQTDENGQYKAVIMEFSLAACSYATMALREIMKVDTSTNAQSKLNNYHEQEQEGKSGKLLEKIGIDLEKPEEEEETSQTSSLLADPTKYELFKNSIINGGVGGEKRPNTDEQESSKRQKTEEES